jgi:hypothetical protein
MKRIKSNATLIIHLIFLCGSMSIWTASAAAQDIHEKDSIRVEELLITDTLELELNGPSRDITFYLNGMVFLSNSKYHQKMIADHITFGVVKSYFVPLDYISLESSRPLFSNDNFPYSPAGMSFTRDYKKVYFTRSEELQEKTFVEKIFEMEIFDGKATGYEQLSFTTGGSRYLHPAISIDESFIIFSSDRTPSKGGLDLFISKRTSKGWTEPESLGAHINSSSHEWYPYLDHHNNLYFSSSGHKGFGGYDVYVCYFNGSTWDPPRNLTSYINTEQDELGFSTHPNKQMALFTRENKGKTVSEVLTVHLSETALLASDDQPSRQQDVSLLLKDLIWSGYAEGNYAASGPAGSNPLVSSAPLIGELEEKSEPVEEESKPEPAVVAAVAVATVEKDETPPKPEPDPNRVTFRVQILSNTKANTKPEVSIEGKRYTTFEYYYKGAYRITVGDFIDLDDANAFRTKCRNAGFDQAWVAAFRGNKRETDPSVFKR